MGRVVMCRCGRPAYRPDSVTGRRAPMRCPECHLIVGRCACSPDPSDAAVTEPPTTETTFAWLIERNVVDHTAEWWTGEDFTRDANRAVKFPTDTAAAATMRGMRLGGYCFVSEHGFASALPSTPVRPDRLVGYIEVQDQPPNPRRMCRRGCVENPDGTWALCAWHEDKAQWAARETHVHDPATCSRCAALATPVRPDPEVRAGVLKALDFLGGNTHQKPGDMGIIAAKATLRSIISGHGPDAVLSSPLATPVRPDPTERLRVAILRLDTGDVPGLMPQDLGGASYAASWLAIEFRDDLTAALRSEQVEPTAVEQSDRRSPGSLNTDARRLDHQHSRAEQVERPDLPSSSEAED